MKNIRIFLSENFHFLVVKFSVYLNRRVFVMCYIVYILYLDAGNYSDDEVRKPAVYVRGR